MTRTGSAAEAFALSKVGTSVTPGWCLANVQYWLDVKTAYPPTATAAWNGAAHKHTDHAPLGAVVPVWFKSANPAGHVALRIHDGTVVTVNGSHVSRFASVEAMAGFGPYMGWAEDIAGSTIWTPPPTPAPAPAPSGIVLSIGSKGQHVVNFQTGMRRIFPAYAKESNVKRGQLISVDGVYGAQSAEWARIFQTKTGLSPDGVVGANTIPKLASYGVIV